MSFAPALLLVAAQLTPSAAPPTGLPLTGEEAENFLSSAEVVALAEYESTGITKPRKATLADGQRRYDAVFKTVDLSFLRVKLPRSRTVLRLKDSYKHEIAAYELDKLLGLGFVPPAVERTIGGETGSLALWVNATMSEWHRSSVKRVNPPDHLDFVNQRLSIQLFLQLIWDADFNNASNVLIDGNWKLYKIDASRAFYTDRRLREPGDLRRFSRKFLAKLEALSMARLDEVMEPWIDPKQRASLWKRRTAILELARKRVSERGEAAVLYP